MKKCYSEPALLENFLLSPLQPESKLRIECCVIGMNSPGAVGGEVQAEELHGLAQRRRHQQDPSQVAKTLGQACLWQGGKLH